MRSRIFVCSPGVAMTWRWTERRRLCCIALFYPLNTYFELAIIGMKRADADMDNVMIKELLDKYTKEKNIFKKFLIGSRMISVSYNETFNLLFKQNFQNAGLKEVQMILTLDAPCWFGDRDKWLIRTKEFGNNAIENESEDCLLAYELVRLKYNNLIQVEKVDFFDEFLTITFEGSNSLSIAYYAESDYAWILEEVSNKMEQERMMVCCQGNELFQNNILILQKEIKQISVDESHAGGNQGCGRSAESG